MDVNDYIREAKRQLNEPRNYKVLAKDPTTTNNDLINQTIDRFTKEQLINDNIANGLKNPSPRTPQFYISPKIQKQGNPDRPVVRFVAIKLVPKNSYLVTMDVRSSYTNIPNAERISTVKTAFDNYSKKTTSTKDNNVLSTNTYIE